MTVPTQPALAPNHVVTPTDQAGPLSLPQAVALRPRPTVIAPPTAEVDRGPLCVPAHCVRVVSCALGQIADFIQRGLEEAGAAGCGDRPCGMARASEVCRRHRALGLTTCAAGQCAVALEFPDRRAA
jgi:hypothetical protein